MMAWIRSTDADARIADDGDDDAIDGGIASSAPAEASDGAPGERPGSAEG